MSTIASPRDPPLRRLHSSTPTSPPPRTSLETVRSGLTSPIDNANPQQHQRLPSPHPVPQGQTVPGAAGVPRRANRAALREYYNLRATAPTSLPRIEVPDSEVPSSELDAPDFDAAAYVEKVVARSSLEDLLRLYAQIVGEVRALDAEKKALVYDNYSKLITATETIRKMRAGMDPLKPMASTLDPAIAQIYSQASSIREAARQSVPAPDTDEGKSREAQARRRRTRLLAVEVLAVPQRLRDLIQEGKVDEAKKEWELPRKLLVSWRDKGVGGDDVQTCIDEGDAAITPKKIEPPRPSSDANRG
ncbi:hypothetical protein HIM_03638 [Hirsutella minnesotensis 3608]|uniref:Vacuolar protein sorting-associated protein 51 homolog n=1 Tax=Hirsutella minnesotensis 3608 TaxID=1043627 RepID=A0A0F7ZLX4_9HYPO|nr:hypothetical protein HIM_03638 [Hirsutella minnesotensis 3608]